VAHLFCQLFLTVCKAELNHFSYSWEHTSIKQNKMPTAIKEDRAGVKNNNGDIFHFFLEYQQAKEHNSSASE
jgi:hypothetical protein